MPRKAQSNSAKHDNAAPVHVRHKNEVPVRYGVPTREPRHKSSLPGWIHKFRSNRFIDRLGTSIASIPALVLLAFAVVTYHAASSNAADGTTVLPRLGNTADHDRRMSQEIVDEHVHALPASSAAKPSQATDTANTASPDPQAEGNSVATASTEQLSGEKQTLDVWQRIRQSRRIDLPDNGRVPFYREQYKREAMWINKILHRGKPFLAHMVQSLEQRYMPVELALLPAIESGFQSTALSAGRAAGLWQIVPITAREIGIERTEWFDGRRDIIQSTSAAMDYLSYLNAEFNGDWELTLAAYNAGPGRVRAAVRKNAKAGLATDYWSLSLPTETQNYVPKLIALLQLVRDPDFTGFDIPDLPVQPTFESVDVGFRISIDKAAEKTGISEAVLKQLNAGLTHGVTAPDGPHELIVPFGTAALVKQRLERVDRRTMFSEPRTHDVIAGDSISSIALLYGISQSNLLNMNGLEDSRIRIGQKLAVLDNKNASASRLEYVVAIGDTLSEIAKRFSVQIKDITTAEGEQLGDDVIHPGEMLKILLPLSGNG